MSAPNVGFAPSKGCSVRCFDTAASRGARHCRTRHQRAAGRNSLHLGDTRGNELTPVRMVLWHTRAAAATGTAATAVTIAVWRYLP